MNALTLVVLAVAAPALARDSAKSDLAMAAVQAPGWDVAGFARLYDVSRAAPAAAFAAPEIARPSEVTFAVGPSPHPKVSDLRLIVPPPAETPAYRRKFRWLLARPNLTDRYDEILLKYAEKYHLDARLLKSIMAAESEFMRTALSPRGARGLMQVMPRTAQEFGVPSARLRNPEFNIAAGAAYVARLFQMAWRKFKLKGVRYHDAPLWLKQRILAAYNAGPRFLFRHGGWYRQTRSYVRKVLLFYHSRVTDFRRWGSTLDYAPRAQISASAGRLY